VPPVQVLVVGETPSLGRSIADLLEAWEVPNRYVHDLSVEPSLETLHERCPVVVVASNGPFCPTARRWLRSELPKVELVVVGSRDPALASAAGIHTVELPLARDRLPGLVRDLLASAGTTEPGLAHRG
jgi:hypothetical protein